MVIPDHAPDLYLGNDMPCPYADAPWLDFAYNEIGEKEIPGDGHNPRIIEFHASTTLKSTEDETPWCSSFVNWCMTEAGLEGTGSARARSWLFWGHGHQISRPRDGCIVILKRGTGQQPGPGVLNASGHVGFFVGYERGSRILLLGGNQSDAVTITNYSIQRILGLRWPGIKGLEPK